MADRVMTAPLAIIKVNGVAVGKAKNIRCTENVRRTKVVGLGALIASEYAPLEYNCTLNMGFFMIDLKKQAIPGALLRNMNTIEEFENTLLLSSDGVQIDVLRKVKDTTSPGGIITPKLEVFASIIGCFITRESFDISEGQISGRDVDFEYTNPILFPL
jgi:hypothetical protein